MQTDITYLATAQGWLYLCTVMDSWSRRIIGWAFSESLRSEFVVAALRMAVDRRGRLPQGLILHSDRGFNMLPSASVESSSITVCWPV